MPMTMCRPAQAIVESQLAAVFGSNLAARDLAARSVFELLTCRHIKAQQMSGVCHKSSKMTPQSAVK